MAFRWSWKDQATVLHNCDQTENKLCRCCRLVFHRFPLPTPPDSSSLRSLPKINYIQTLVLGPTFWKETWLRHACREMMVSVFRIWIFYAQFAHSSQKSSNHMYYLLYLRFFQSQDYSSWRPKIWGQGGKGQVLYLPSPCCSQYCAITYLYIINCYINFMK